MSFSFYKDKFEGAIPASILQMGDKCGLRDACEYALQRGKRLRPLIVLMIADALGKGLDVMPAAFGVECFHAASLIVDDLPCMDNDLFRRGRPTLHKVFGETIALLASYTLMATGYGSIEKNGSLMKAHPEFQKEADLRSVICLESATRCAGLQGATQGQFLDLFSSNADQKAIEEIICKKTVTLFEVSFIFGWIFGGGDLSALPLLKEGAFHLGLAFQVADDLEDAIQDASHKNPINLACCLGKEAAVSFFEREIVLLRKALVDLQLWTPSFQEILARLHQRQDFFAHQLSASPS